MVRDLGPTYIRSLPHCTAQMLPITRSWQVPRRKMNSTVTSFGLMRGHSPGVKVGGSSGIFLWYGYTRRFVVRACKSLSLFPTGDGPGFTAARFHHRTQELETRQEGRKKDKNKKTTSFIEIHQKKKDQTIIYPRFSIPKNTFIIHPL